MPEVKMPKMGDSMEEGRLLRWMKREGDEVRVDEPIAEIETDKATVEMTAESSGKLSKIVVQEGETVAVGAVLAYIGEPGPSPNGHPPAKSSNVPDKIVIGDSTIPPATQQRGGESSQQPEEAAPAVGPEAERVKASPLARKMAESMGIDLAQVKGSGPGGRIVERDIKGLGEKPSAAPAARQLAQPVGPSLEGQDVEVGRIRKTIARRTVQSKQTIPHFYLTMPVEMDRALAVLDQLNATSPDQKITINDMIVKSCAVALKNIPDVNVSWTADDKVRHYASINIGIAVGTDEGLTVPVINDCGSKTLRQISAEARPLIEKARKGQLTPQEMSNGTFSVSNLGMFGIEEFGAIINPPESAILAVGAVLPEVAVDESGAFVARKKMRMTLSCDHRTVDGLLGAKFLKEVRRLLESPYELLA